jgi:hypothetical protein
MSKTNVLPYTDVISTVYSGAFKSWGKSSTGNSGGFRTHDLTTRPLSKADPVLFAVGTGLGGLDICCSHAGVIGSNPDKGPIS